MHPVLRNTQLAPNVYRLDVRAPRIAMIREPGQFVIVRRGEGAERIPLTIAGSDLAMGSISLVIQAIGKATTDLVALQVGDEIRDIAGPLGHPTDLLTAGQRAVCVGGGVGTAVIAPVVAALAGRGVRVHSIIGARSQEWVIFETELAACGPVSVCTDDGSYGRHGFVTDELVDQIAAGDIDAVYAVGPLPMMRAVAGLTGPAGIRTIVSLNPIMIDGTGMCGGCRVTVDGVTRYACVDGPEFDAAGVDFAELASRLSMYRDFERDAWRVGIPVKS